MAPAGGGSFVAASLMCVQVALILGVEVCVQSSGCARVSAVVGCAGCLSALVACLPSLVGSSV